MIDTLAYVYKWLEALHERTIVPDYWNVKEIQDMIADEKESYPEKLARVLYEIDDESWKQYHSTIKWDELSDYKKEECYKLANRVIEKIDNLQL